MEAKNDRGDGDGVGDEDAKWRPRDKYRGAHVQVCLVIFHFTVKHIALPLPRSTLFVAFCKYSFSC